MAALTQARRRRNQPISRRKMPVAANVVIYAGAAVVVDVSAAGATRGFYEPATGAADKLWRGMALETVDNTGGANGAKYVEVDFQQEIPVEHFKNDTGGTPVAATDRGKYCYFLDDQTVTITNTGATAGRIFDLADDGRVIVEATR